MMQSRILHGDCREVLRDLPAESVHCVVTSPPYWGLRDYGTALWIGGSSACDHKHKTEHQKQGATSARKGRANVEAQRSENFIATCKRCGAERVDKGIGLEPTFDEHLANLVAVFREVWRVLRDDGTLWLNYGDAYAGGGRGLGSGKQLTNKGSAFQPPFHPEGFKPKDLMMMPARVAMALQADGWWLRSEIVWHKPNPMPESVTDRPTNAHEKLFLLAKSSRYFYDAEAVRVSAKWTRENNPEWQHQRAATNEKKGCGNRNAKSGGFTEWSAESGANLRNVWTIPTHSFKEAHFATFPPALVEPCIKAGTSERGVCGECGAPWKRQTMKGAPLKDQMAACGADSTGGYSGQSMKDYAAAGAQDASATKRRILEGMRERKTTGWVPTCCDCHVPIMTPVPDGDVRSDPTMQTGRKGLNRERNTNSTRAMTRGEQRDYARQIRASENREQIRGLAGEAFDHYVRTDQSGARPLPPDVLAQCIERGWLKPASAQCDCACKDAGDPVPATVLDPFAGSGTVGEVALAHGRSFIGVEINAEYVAMGTRRTETVAPLFQET